MLSLLSIIASVAFVVGSVMFLPTYAEFVDIGSGLFAGGSLLFVKTSSNEGQAVDLLGATRIPPKSAVVCNVVGSVLYTVGSVLFLSFIGQATLGAACFIAGSVLFTIAPLLQLCATDPLLDEEFARIELGNRYRSCWILRPIDFVQILSAVGAVLFLAGSVIYVLPQPSNTLLEVAAWMFIVGAACFLCRSMIPVVSSKYK